MKREPIVQIETRADGGRTITFVNPAVVIGTGMTRRVLVEEKRTSVMFDAHAWAEFIDCIEMAS